MKVVKLDLYEFSLIKLNFMSLHTNKLCGYYNCDNYIRML